MLYRVQKLLSGYGYCSRRKAEELIKSGRVRVNSRVISIGDKASPDDKIYVDGKLVAKENKVYLMFHKPVGCITALSDKKFKTIMAYIKVKERVFPIGRLDFNTSGLLLLTNDGDFANKVMHPRYEVSKTYQVGIHEPISEETIAKIEEGVEIEGRKTSANVKKVNPTLIELTIHEGRKRIVRKIFEKLGFKLRFLKRMKIGRLGLEGLQPGEYKYVTIEKLKAAF